MQFARGILRIHRTLMRHSRSILPNRLEIQQVSPALPTANTPPLLLSRTTITATANDAWPSKAKANTAAGSRRVERAPPSNHVVAALPRILLLVFFHGGKFVETVEFESRGRGGQLFEIRSVFDRFE